jgi:hypothetical protein
MRTIAITSLFLIILSIAVIAWLNHSPAGKKFKAGHFNKKEEPFIVPGKTTVKLSTKAKEAKGFVQNKPYNQEYCFLIDMSLPSNQKRFFVYDLKKDTLIKSGLVTHGRCNQQWLEGRKYSNEVGCGCTSLGKYRIGNSYYGRFGLAFKLHGLDKTNSNAFKRYVVLHSHECVPDYEVANDICQSDGCPTVSPQFLKQLDPMIKTSRKPVLLWIYE